MVDRALAALQGELARRQRLLHLAGNQPDLRAYTARRAADPRLEPLPSLLVVVDEFGELLTARPEFLELFSAIGRVGRSLGMHLLLASQRLDEGRLRGLESHLRFRICLRTFSAAESTAVLGVPDAYHLPAAPGSALIKVDASSPVPFTAALVSGARPDPPGSRGSTDLAGSGRRPRRGWSAGPSGVASATGRGDRPRPAAQDAEPGWLRVPVGVVDRPLRQVAGAAGPGPVGQCRAPGGGRGAEDREEHAALHDRGRPGRHLSARRGAGLRGGPRRRAPPSARRPAASRRRVRPQGGRAGPSACVRELRSLLVERERRFRDLGVDSMASWHELRRSGLDLGGYGEVFLLIDNWAGFVRELPELEAEVTELAASGICATGSMSSWPPTAGPSCVPASGRTSAAASSCDSTTRWSPSSAARQPRPCRSCRVAASPRRPALPGGPARPGRAPSSNAPWPAGAARSHRRSGCCPP